jgi:hypothetical protein
MCGESALLSNAQCDLASQILVFNTMERREQNAPGFRPTDTVALSTVQRLNLYQRARKQGWAINLLGFVLLAAGGVFAGLLVQGSVAALASRPFFLVMVLGLGGTGMSVLWTRRVSWSLIAGVWLGALIAGFVGVILGA